MGGGRRVNVVVWFATLGHTADHVLGPLRKAEKETRSFHVFFGSPLLDEGRAALRTVREFCGSKRIELVEHAVPGAFDYANFLRAFSEAWAGVSRKSKVLFNASGGTRVMQMAATIFCFTHEIELHYYDEYESQEGRVIPLQAFRSLDRVGPTPRAILQFLQTQGPSDMSSLAQRLSLAPSTITQHVQGLETSGAVVIERLGKRRVVRLLPELTSFRLDDVP